MEHIASAQNSRIKHLAKLAASAAKRYAFGQTLLEGTHLLEAFLNAGGRPECVYVAENRLEDAEISALLQRMPSEKTVSVAAPILGRLTGLGEGGNIVALIKLPSAAKLPEDGDCVVLERVQDPGNIGTILRSAAAAGVRDIVLGADCADVWSPKVLRAAMGAHFLLTLHPAASGRIYAAYGGVYISVALLWLWLADGVRPQWTDWIGIALCLSGMTIIMWGARS